MSNSTSGLIYEAIPKVIADVGAVGKDKVNRQQGFKYRSVDDVFNALNPALAKNGVFIVPLILQRECTEVGKTSKGATIVKVMLKVKFTFYASDGSHIETIIYGEAMDMGDKGTNKAMSIAYKYACFQVFCIPTEEMQDPDANSPAEEIVTQTAAPKQQPAQKPASEQKPEVSQDVSTEERITPVMLQTIREQQIRTGVSDEAILGMRAEKAKKVSEMTITEYKAVMKKFEKTPDRKDVTPRE